jgi:acyl carrier protein
MQVERELPGGIRLSRDEVLRGVKQVVGEQMGIAPHDVQETHDLFDDIGCDSLDVVEITMETEEHFGISVPDEVAGRVRKVQDIVDGVLELLGSAQSE